MRIYRLALFFLIQVLAATTLLAQKPVSPAIGSITGKLMDAKNNPVSYATVTLLKSDSTVANGDLSKDDGSFSISPTGIGNFILRIESIGILTKYVTVQITADAPNKKMGSIKLGETENKLGEVSVVGEKPIMELKVDKKVFNVEKNTTTAGGSAADVLQNVPSVSVDADGNVSLRGNSDVTILIDGKPSTLLGTDVASALQSLPAGSIESVEVITNPSAKYDAQGTSGIINIITKKDGRFGLNGNATLGVGTNNKYNGNLGLNVRKGKWGGFLNSSFRINNTYNNVTTDRYEKSGDSSFHTYEHVPRDFDGFFNTIGATFDPDKNNSFTLTENINVMQFGYKDTSNYTIYQNPNETDALYNQKRYSNSFGAPFSLSSAIDYKHKFKKKDEELSVDVTYASTTFHGDQDYYTYNTSLVPATVSMPLITQLAPSNGTNSSFNGWADYTDPLFTNNGKLGLGFKSQFYNFTSNNRPTVDTTSINSVPTTDYSLLSDYSYSQQIHAVYANWSDQIGKFSYQAGLRFEDAIYDGSGELANVTAKDTSFHSSFANLFPSAFISYKLTDQQSIYLTYSRRTNRPNFRQLLPFVDLSNPGTVNTGNPSLVPEFIDNIEFSYNQTDKRGDNIILSAYYSYTRNLIETITIPLDSAQVRDYNVSPTNLLSVPINIASGTTYGFEGTGHVQILPIWDATINVNFFQNELIIPAADSFLKNNQGFTWFGKVNTNIKLPKNFSFQVNGNYESPKVITQGTLKQTYWVDMALRKNFWKNKATLILNCSDVFKTHRFITNYNLTYYDETINRVKETRIGNVTFTYRFGKSDLGKKHDKQDNEARPTDQDRGNNLKQGDDNDQGGSGGSPKGGGANH